MGSEVESEAGSVDLHRCKGYCTSTLDHEPDRNGCAHFYLGANMIEVLDHGIREDFAGLPATPWSNPLDHHSSQT